MLVLLVHAGCRVRCAAQCIGVAVVERDRFAEMIVGR
jgi:hypothetical protein